VFAVHSYWFIGCHQPCLVHFPSGTPNVHRSDVWVVWSFAARTNPWRGSHLSPSELSTLRPARNEAKSLEALVARFGCASSDSLADVGLRGISLNTADLRPGDLFVALPGVNEHGAQYASVAREMGAVAVLVDPSGETLARASGLPVVVVDSPREKLGAIAAWLYDTAAPGLTLFGVTGTNGKTSTVHILEALLLQLGVRAGLSSTAQRRFGEVERVSGLTTPEATELHALFARMREDSVSAVAVEVSAQALSRYRVDGVVFDVAGFTNLSHDHLDDYGDMESYLSAKLPLFQPDRSRRAVISLDSEWGDAVLRAANVPVTTVSSTPGIPADWNIEITAEKPTGVDFTLEGPSGERVESSISVIGKHMAANAGLAIAMLVDAGYDFDAISEALTRDGGIEVHPPGRTERVSGAHGPTVYVDFGHSADAFTKTLDAVRHVTRGRVIMVFGADGDRDTTKRAAMARAAVAGSDLLVVTDHHPRFENPESIRATLMKAAREADPSKEPIEVADPKRAIRVAVGLAVEGDSILWAGPGHQNYRDIEGVHVPYSARQEARDALAEAGWS
jgi:UDP-N-acetylmuramoyl-L-alanyl-D-glutamate--2,6-diaminopimelate ligase